MGRRRTVSSCDAITIFALPEVATMCSRGSRVVGCTVGSSMMVGAAGGTGASEHCSRVVVGNVGALSDKIVPFP